MYKNMEIFQNKYKIILIRRCSSVREKTKTKKPNTNSIIPMVKGLKNT